MLQPADEAGGVLDDLAAFDAALAPIRRAVAYGRRRGVDGVRYLEVTLGRWLDRATRSPHPAAVDPMLGALRAALDGFDDLAADEKAGRLSDLYAAISTIDRLLSLPLPFVVSTGAGAAAAADEARPGAGAPAAAAELPEPSGRSGRRGARRVRPKAPEPAPPEPVAIPANAVRFSDEGLGGAFLSDLDAADEVIDALADAGLTRLGQILGRRPATEEIVEPVLGAGRLQAEGRQAVGGRIRRRWTVLRPDGSRASFAVLHGAGPLRVRWSAGAPDWLIDRMVPEQRAVLVGTVQVTADGLQELVDPELAVDDGRHAVRLARYGVPGVDDAAVRALVQQGLESVERLVDPLPAELVARRGLVPLADALALVHLKGDRARNGARRLAYDEALLAQIALLWSRFQGPRERGLSHGLLHRQAAAALQRSDVDLTDEQQDALEDIKRDLRAPVPMRRVLTGEVGVGKGLVALLSTLMVAENKNQVLVLAPDGATAEQRFAFTEPLLRELGFVGRLYLDAPTRSQQDAIKRGEVHVLFGTADLLERELEFRRLGLVVVGERDSFGGVVARVDALRAPSPDLLVITSTPVPAPVLFAAYPGFDLTVLRAASGREVASTVVPASERERVYLDAAEAVRRGEQVMVVFPMSRGADAIDLSDARRIVETLEQRVFVGARVRLFHGAMSRDERYTTWAGFRDRAIDVVLATTHFEAGPAVPGASLAIIEQADRMSLPRLHRVRGHLSSSRFDPRCVLITGEDPDAEGLVRVERFAGTAHGFEVAVHELEQRGLEAMISGEPADRPNLSWVDPVRDLDLLLQARSDARALLEEDPGLRRPTSAELARYVRARWSDLLATPCPIQGGGAPGRRRRRRRRR
jgi:ATP-dependent DNA helicase RecG